MNVGLYSIYDTKTGIYHPPMCCINDASAIREHAKIFCGNNDFAKYASDYQLVKVGMYNDQTGTITPCERQMITTAADIVAAYKKAETSNG